MVPKVQPRAALPTWRGPDLATLQHLPAVPNRRRLRAAAAYGEGLVEDRGVDECRHGRIGSDRPAIRERKRSAAKVGCAVIPFRSESETLSDSAQQQVPETPSEAVVQSGRDVLKERQLFLSQKIDVLRKKSQGADAHALDHERESDDRPETELE
jgi:hypothetical protein